MDNYVIWRTSSYSGLNNDCVEVARFSGWCAVRDSKLGASGSVLSFGAKAFGAFLAHCAAGNLDR